MRRNKVQESTGKGTNENKAKSSLGKAYGVPGSRKPTTSSTVAASYADKYGSTNAGDAIGKTGTSTKNVKSTKTSTVLKTEETKRLQEGGKNTKILGQVKSTKPPVQEVALQKPSIQIEEDAYEEDFEEEYASDFEEGASSDDNNNEEKSQIHHQVATKDLRDEETDSSPNFEKSFVGGVLVKETDFNGQSSESSKEIDNSVLISAEFNTVNAAEETSLFFDSTISGSKNRDLLVALAATSSEFDSKVSKLAPREDTSSSSEKFLEIKKIEGKRIEVEKASNVSKFSETSKHITTNNLEIKTRRAKTSAELLKIIRLQKTKEITLLHMNVSHQKQTFTDSRPGRQDQGSQPKTSSCHKTEQTIIIPTMDKWTQRPPNWSASKTEIDIQTLREEALGVGVGISGKISRTYFDTTGESSLWDQRNCPSANWGQEINSSWNNVSNFVSRASRKVLYVLESQKRLALPVAVNKTGEEDKFTEVQFSRGLQVFNNLQMACLTCSGDFIASANFYPIEKSRRKHEAKCIITVWSLKEPSRPKYFLRMWGKVTVLDIFLYGHVIIAGGNDGGLAFWDFDENTEFHKFYQEHLIRTATIDTRLISDGHKDAIIGLKTYPETRNCSMVLSIDKSGILKIWTLERSKDYFKDPTYPRNTAYWSKLNLKLKRNIDLNLRSLSENRLVVSSFTTWVDFNGSVNFAAGTVNSFVVHGVLQDEENTTKSDLISVNSQNNILRNDENLGSNESLRKPDQDVPISEKSEYVFLQKLYDEDCDKSSWITCIDYTSSCSLLVAGSNDRKCRLYSLPNKKLVGVIDCESDPIRVRFSKRRMSLLYIITKSKVLIYDLAINKFKYKANPSKNTDVDIEDFGIYTTALNEFPVLLCPKELKITMLLLEKDSLPLTDKEVLKFESNYS